MKIIIVGCGRMGSGLAKKLSTEGHFVTVIDANPEAFSLLGSSFKLQTITGFGLERDVLLQAKIDRADALAAVTASDEVNIVVARLAKNVFNVPNVIVRLFDLGKSEIYRRLGMQTIDPTTWGIDQAYDLLHKPDAQKIQSVGSGEVSMMDLDVPAAWIGRKVNELSTPGEFTVIALSNGNDTFLPAPDTEFQENDIIHMAVARAFGDRLNTLLG
jgi:trk system potassium uptake protein TrkA